MSSSDPPSDAETDATRTAAAPRPLEEVLEPAPIEAGVKIGRFVVVSELGQGGMGAVYAAFDPELNRKVAVKLLHAKAASKGHEATLRLQREAQALARVSHPNVISVHDVGMHAGGVFIAMEFIEGVTLRDWIKDKPLKKVLDAFCQAGDGLTAVHAAGLVHRDFKASNVVVSHDGRVKVLDLGLARLSGENEPTHTLTSDSGDSNSEDSHEGSNSGLEVQLTRVGQVNGTPGYIAPELLSGAMATGASDQFSFGVALFKALFGEMPFRSRSIDAYAASVRKGPPKAPPKNSTAPRWLFDVVRRTLESAPEKRFASMEELLRTLRSDPTQARRRRLAYAAVALAFCAAIAGGIRATNPPCETAASTLQSLWPPEKFQALEDKLAGRNPALRSVVRRGLTLLDQRIREWAEVREEVCRVEHPRFRLASNSRLSACLTRKELEFKVLLDTLDQSDALIAAKSAQLIRMSVTDPSCRYGLERQQPDDVSAENVSLTRELRAQLLKATAYRLLGRYSESKTLALQAAERARTAKLAGFHGEALFLAGWAELELAELDDAKTQFHDAAHLLLTAKVDHLALASLCELIELLALKEADLEKAKEQLRLAESLFSRQGSPPDLELNILTARARVAKTEGKRDELIALSRRGIAVARATFGEYSFEHVRAWSVASNALWTSLRFRESVEASEKAIKIAEALLGKDDPQLVWRYGDLGEGYRALGRDDEALQWLERAYDLALRGMDPQSSDMADVIIGLAYQLTLTDPARALTLLSRPVAIYEKAQSPGDLAWAIQARARAWIGLNRGAEGLADCERAHQLIKELGTLKEEQDRADTARCRGKALFVLRRYKEAAAELTNARTKWKPLTSPGSRARLALELAQARQALGANVDEVRKLAEEGLREIADFPQTSIVKQEITAFLQTLPANGRASR